MDFIIRFFEKLFQTRLPLLSSLFNFIITMISSLSLSLVLVINTPRRSIIYSNIIFVSIVVGVLIQIVLIGLLTMRFQYPEGEMNAIFTKIKRKLLLRNDVIIWSRKSLKPYAVIFSTPIQRAIIISTSMIHLMRRMPQEAEVLLAEKMLSVDRQRVFLLPATMVSLFIFTSLSTFEYLSVIRYLGGNISGLYSVFFTLCLVVGIVFLVLRSILWVRGPETVIITQEWGLHPRIAEQQLIADHLFSDEEIKFRLRNIRRDEEQSRFTRRILLFLLSMVPIIFGLFIIFIILAYLGLYIYGYGVLFGLPTIIFFIFYYSLKNRDSTALEELWNEAEVIQDPIWLD